MRALTALATVLLTMLPLDMPESSAGQSVAEPLPGEVILLWPGDAPGSDGLPLRQTVTERSDDPSVNDRAVTGILQPSLTVLRPEDPNGAAVIVAPGGGYQRITFDKEGVDIARWLNGLGVTAFVLTYRLPGEGHAAPAVVSLQDAQRAVRILRSRADELEIDPGRIGIIGFSAGGHLAGTLAADLGSRVYTPVDGADRLDPRPDFVVLVYPVVGSDFVDPDALARYPGLRRVVSEYPLVTGVSKDWPPTFLVHAADDVSWYAEGSVRLFEALRAAGVPAELHVFASGGHGFGIRKAEGPVSSWPVLCGEWMRRLGVVAAPQNQLELGG